MIKHLSYFVILFALVFVGCIGDDFVLDEVDPVLRITTSVDTMQINTMLQFEQMYLNNVGAEENVMTTWSSTDPSVISISTDGLAEALMEGSSVIKVSYPSNGDVLSDELLVNVGQNATSMGNDSVEGMIQTTSSYVLKGDFTLEEMDGGLRLSLADNYQASTALPGLYIYLSNNKNSIANAMEIGAVEVFSGAHQYDISNAGINDYSYILYFCKPFNVKVGDGTIQ